MLPANFAESQAQAQNLAEIAEFRKISELRAAELRVKMAHFSCAARASLGPEALESAILLFWEFSDAKN